MNEEWANSVTQRAMEMAEMDPELMPRVNLIIAKEKVLRSIAGLIGFMVFAGLVTLVPVVIWLWKAAL